MKIAILETNKIQKHNYIIDAHYRNSILLRSVLNADLIVTDKEYKDAINKKYDVIIVSYGTFYSPYDSIVRILRNNLSARKIWITNEYNLQVFAQIAAYNHEIIGNFERQVFKSKKTSKFYSVNLNLLMAHESNEISEKTHDIVYYGTYRPNRERYFKEYFKERKICLSTSTKNMKKFSAIGCEPIYVRKLSWQPRKETLNNFRTSLYIEDEATHENFNNLANRWYEAGFCNNVVLFDRNCRNTVRKSEIGYFESTVKDYYVSSFEEMVEKQREINSNFEKHLAIQKTWRVSESLLKQQVLDEIVRIVKGQNG